jgi:hypothetical protein
VKKRDIPKPKYGLGDTVIFSVPGDGNYNPRRDVGTIAEITIKITPAGYSIRYSFVDKEEFWLVGVIDAEWQIQGDLY